MIHGIIVTGASGAGTTTFAKALAKKLNFTHLDIDDYFWSQSYLPFTIKRPRDERIALLNAAIVNCRGFVMSGSMSGWSKSFEKMFDLAIYIETPTDIRIQRLKKREFERYGTRILEGGDMYQNHIDFIEWAKSYDMGKPPERSKALHEEWLRTLPCPVMRVDGTEDYNTIAVEIVQRYYVKEGQPWRIAISDLNELKKYRFTVIFARYHNKWLYARHKERDTYETAGGRIEKGESTLDCAKRELYEETGAIKFDIHPAFDYAVHRDTEFSYGQVFYAEIKTIGRMPDSEMAQVMEFSSIPDKMTYPQILPVLFDKIQNSYGLFQAAKTVRNKKQAR